MKTDMEMVYVLQYPNGDYYAKPNTATPMLSRARKFRQYAAAHRTMRWEKGSRIIRVRVDYHVEAEM